MRLHNIVPNKGERKARKRVGRGRGSGHGKTSGSGHNGQKSRSGGSIRIGFEGGQMPLYRKLPRRGFNNYNFRTEYSVVNLKSISQLDNSAVIDRDVLVKNGLVRANSKLIKILAFGDIDKPYKIKADKFSESAKEKINKFGGEAIETMKIESNSTNKNTSDEQSDK